MFMPASISPSKSRRRIKSFSVSVSENLAIKASSSRLNASRSAGEQSAVHIRFRRRPRRESRRSKIEVSGICRIFPLQRSPHLFRGVDAELELGLLLLDGQVVAVVRAREPALRGEAEVLERHDLGGGLDAPLERVFLFQLRHFRADQPE